MPYFPIWLTDLVMIDESMAGVQNDQINVSKLSRLAKVLDQFLACQTRKYPFTLKPELQDYIIKGSTVCTEEEGLFALSLKREPREPK
jgi:hypothetical protein